MGAQVGPTPLPRPETPGGPRPPGSPPHRGSTSITTTADGTFKSALHYSAYGDERCASGDTPTDYRYTGQLSKMETVGLYYYNTRWYDPYITQFTQPDTIIPYPYNPLDWNRYSYVRYNPINNTDPSGHAVKSDADGNGCSGQGPACMLEMHGYNTEASDDAIESYIDRHLEYDPLKDSNLEGVNLTIVSSAKLRVDCWNGSSASCLTIYGIAGASSYAMFGMGPDAPIGNTPGPKKQFAQDTIGDPDCPGCGYANPPIIAGRGHSRGRVQPSNLKEKLAMDQVRLDPLAWGVPRPKVPMTDARWPGSEGWIKYSANINGVEVHFVYNPKTWQVDDFKFPIP